MSVRGRLAQVGAGLVAITALAAAFGQGAAQSQAGPAQSQSGPALAQPGRGERVRIITIPKFVVTAVKMKALDETGADFWGDDEVYAVYADFNPIGELTTSLYDNVDSGEIKKFRVGDRCMAPQPTCERGAHALHFAVALWERDELPFWDFLPGTIAGTHDRYQGGIDSGDELIGRSEISLSQADLVAALPNVGDSAEYTVEPTGGDDGSYEFTYRITRLANVRIPIIIGPGRPQEPISLQATATAAGGGGNTVTLTWSGATTPTVDIYRNGPAVATTANDGNYVEMLPAGTYQYRVCNAGSTSFCSVPVSVTVP